MFVSDAKNLFYEGVVFFFAFIYDPFILFNLNELLWLVKLRLKNLLLSQKVARSAKIVEIMT